MIIIIIYLFLLIKGGEAKQEQAQHPTQWQLTVSLPQQGGPRRVGVCSHQCGHKHHCQHTYPRHRYNLHNALTSLTNTTSLVIWIHFIPSFSVTLTFQTRFFLPISS